MNSASNGMNSTVQKFELKPLVIGNLRLEIPIMLAPMAGYTHYPFRLVCHQQGSALSFTEMVMSEGIVRHSPQTLHYFETLPNEGPVGAHIYGANPEALAGAAQIAEQTGRFALVDINGGCPVRKIRRKGAGVSLMKEPETIYQIIRSVRQAVKLPVTFKTRIGLTEDFANIDEVAQAVEEGGADALIVHARLAENGHSGPPDLLALRAVKEQCKIPVIGNGGIIRPEDAATMVNMTGVDGLMIGRAAIGNPWIFAEMQAACQGIPYQPPSPKERRDIIEQHLRLLLQLMTEEERHRRRRRQATETVACKKFRSQFIRYLGGIRGLGELRRRLDDLNTIEETLAAADQLLNPS
jgi:nifR3 family TIM-barrel protein